MRTAPIVLLVSTALMALVPAASAHLEATATFPTIPIAMDAGETVTLALEIECTHVLARPGTGDLPIVVTVDEATLTLTGPASFDVPRTACIDPTEVYATTGAYTIAGDRYLPGLAPITVAFTATLEANAAADLLDDVDPGVAGGAITPAAIVDLRADPFGQAQATPGSASTSTTITNAGNVDLALKVTGSPVGGPSRGSLDIEGGDIVLARATSGTNPTTGTLSLVYTAPTNGTGTDRYTITIQPTVVLDQALRADPVVLAVAFPYTNVDGVAQVQVNGNVENPEATTFAPTNSSPAAPVVVLMLVLVGLAFVARRNA